MGGMEGFSSQSGNLSMYVINKGLLENYTSTTVTNSNIDTIVSQNPEAEARVPHTHRGRSGVKQIGPTATMTI